MAPALEALPPTLTRARGWGDPLDPLRCEHLLGFSRQSVAAKRKGEKKNKAEEAQEDPCRLAFQEKGLRRGERTNSSPISSRRIPKPRGAQNGTPRKTPRSRTHGQNGRNRQKRRDTNKEKKPARQVRVRGRPVTT